MRFALYSRSPTCFYCGTRSDQSPTVRQFRCQQCEAVNYLDESGEITDPPPQSTPRPAKVVRYAHAAALTSSPTESLDGLFCRNCLQNQFLIKENLSNYLPPDDDPHYEKYLASYDSYRKSLEQRYPQVCSECAPKVKTRIKASAYIARSDHLGKMSKRTKQNFVQRKRGYLLARISIGLGGIIWAFSALGQACWHALVAISIPVHGLRHSSDEYIGTDSSAGTRIDVCLHETLLLRKASSGCITKFSQAMPAILLTGFLTLWWNNWLWTRYFKSGGTMERVTEYYILQALLLIVRIFGWKSFGRAVIWGSEETSKGVHLFIALLILTVYPISLRIIRIDTGARSAPSFSTNDILFDITSQSMDPTTPHPSRSSDLQQPFPFHKFSSPAAPSILRPMPRQSSSASSHLADEYDDPDAMDWTPSTKRPITSFTTKPRTSVIPNTATFPGPSPFRGTLPPAPVAPAHKLRRIPSISASPFRKATDAQKTSYSASMSHGAHLTRRKIPDYAQTADNHYDSDATAADTEDEETGVNPIRSGRSEIQIAAPRFWPSADLDRKTGLEDIFEGAFTIEDSPLMGGQFVSAAVSEKGEKWDGRGERTDFKSYGSPATMKENNATAAGSSGVLLLVGIVSLFALGISWVVVSRGWI